MAVQFYWVQPSVKCPIAVDECPPRTCMPRNVSTADEDNILMCKSGPSSKYSGFEPKQDSVEAQEDNKLQDKLQHGVEEEIEFEDNPFQSPLFNQLITEETLRDDEHTYIFWVSLRLPISKDPVNLMATVYDA